MNNPELGRFGEDQAALEYQKLGYRVLARNVRVHGVKQIGEIDLILAKDKELVFVEVKTRRNSYFGTGAEAVDWRKQKRLVRACQSYLQRYKQYQDWSWRIDVAQVDIDKTRASVIILVNVIEDLD